MLSQTQSKYIRSLALLKFRKEHQCFLAEGEKIALEWLHSTHKIKLVAGLSSWLDEHQQLIAAHREATVIHVSEDELKRISTLQTPNKVLLVVSELLQPDLQHIGDWCLALDGIRDPGNMGTILRIADWFGIQDVVCSSDCVDAFNPKVIQSAMGAHLRVNIHTTELTDFVRDSLLPSVAAVLGGQSIYDFAPPAKGIIVIGNEATGIRPELAAICDHAITIPRGGGAESLNAGVSAGILCALLLRP